MIIKRKLFNLRIVNIIALLIGVLTVHLAQAEIIASFDINQSYTSTVYSDNNLVACGATGPVEFGPINEETDSNDRFGALYDPFGFLDSLLDNLTNGEDDYIAVQFYAIGGGTAPQEVWLESEIIGNSPYSLNGIDLYGYSIDSLFFVLPQFSVTNTNSTYQYALTGTFEIEGTPAIPEPNSVVLVLLGGGSLYLRRKKFPTRQSRGTRKGGRN